MFVSVPLLFVFAFLLYLNDKKNKGLLNKANDKADQLSIRASDLSFELDIVKRQFEYTQSLLDDEKADHERTTEKLNKYREIAENVSWEFEVFKSQCGLLDEIDLLVAEFDKEEKKAPLKIGRRVEH